MKICFFEFLCELIIIKIKLKIWNNSEQLEQHTALKNLGKKSCPKTNSFYAFGKFLILYETLEKDPTNWHQPETTLKWKII